MKKNFILYLLFFGLLGSFSSTAAEADWPTLANPPDKARPLATVVSAESWLEGMRLGENMLAVYFNATQAEFIDFATAGNINELKVDLYWQPHSRNSIQLIQSTIIDNIYDGFNIGVWAMNVENPRFDNGDYFVQITINGTECGDLTELRIVEEEIEEEEEELPIELPEYNCGDNYTYPPNTNEAGLSTAVAGELFLIGGFPILLQEVSGGSGTFSGSGLVPLPFGDKVVKVEFNNVLVNTDREIYQGSVTAKSDSPGNYPDFDINPPPLEAQKDICLKLPPAPGYNDDGSNQNTGLNDWGFNPSTGIHGETNTEYDRNGFDVYGNHEETGGPFNEQGCSREGLTIDNEVCDPGGGANPDATNFANSVAPTISTEISGIIEELKTALADSLAQLGCGEIRTELVDLVDDLEYSPEFIFGENNRYLDEGMHLEFQSEPKPLVLNVERDANAKLLEKRHVDLYHCDRANYAVTALIDALTAMLSETGLQEVKDEILDRIRDWTAYESGLYVDDPAAYRDWLILQIGKIMKENSGLDDSYVEASESPSEPTPAPLDESLRSIFEFDRSQNWYQSTAALEGNFGFDETFTLEDADFFFRQGDQSINGVDRAYYLEGLARQQMFMTEFQNLLPIRVEKTVANRTYTIYLDNITFGTGGASLDAYIIVEDPESGRRFVFKGLGIGFGPTGTSTDSRLELVSDVEIRLNNAAMLILKGSENTFVAWSCGGFDSLSIDAEIEFCRDFITPLDETTLEPLPEPARYRLEIPRLSVSSWLEFDIEVNAKPFAVTQYQDVKWKLTQMVLDFNSGYTPDFTPLEGYASPFWNGEAMAPQWKGFYLAELTATLPNDFSQDSEPITAGATDILIDGSGFSGSVFATNLVNIDDGTLGGWPFSINRFEIAILNNQFGGAGMGGEVKVPLFEENMIYNAVIYPGSLYKFSVTTTEDVTVDMFLATGTISQNSSIEVVKDEEGFKATATLSGSISVDSEGNSAVLDKVKFPDLTFQNLEILNRAPYIRSGTWGITSTATDEPDHKVNGFGLRLTEIQPHTPGNGIAGLKFKVDVILNEAVSLNASGDFDLEGELSSDDQGRQKWVFKGININALEIDASFPGVAKVKGQLEWFGSEAQPLPKWGKGFRGLLEAEFKGMNIALKAAGQFGKVDDHKYFFVDALAELGAAAPGIGVLRLKGLGGGVSWGMVTNNEPVGLEHSSANPSMPAIGQSFSGMGYDPVPGIELGFKAIAVIATLKEEIFNGMVSLSFTFNGSNGLEQINLYGSGQFLKGIDTTIKPEYNANGTAPPPTVSSKLAAYVDLTYNFSEPSFHGNLQVFLNAGFVKGTGTGGKMVNTEIHFDPTQWYIYIGRPEKEQRCGVEFTIPGIPFAVEANAYLDVGTNVPPMPRLPANVREIAYKVNDNKSLRQSGAGFVFGAAIDFELSASIAGIVSAKLEAEAGFDIMLRKYEGLHCQGSSAPVGIDGWYAGGQLYAYVYGELKAFGINVASAGIAAVLQARLPNPFWAQATIGIRIKLLFFTVSKSLKLELGDDCILVSDDPQDVLGMEVITMMEPFEGAENVETDFRPKAFFALPLGEKVDITNPSGTQTFEYEVKLHSTRLYTASNPDILHDKEISFDGTSVSLIPVEMLPSEEEITFEVEVRIFENGSHLTNEVKTVTFVTAPTLEYIPESNVLASYPINGMINYHKDEYSAGEGYILLKAGMSDLFVNVPEGYYDRVRLEGASGLSITYPFDYDVLSKKISFALPGNIMNNDELYKIELIRMGGPGPAAANASSSSTTTTTSSPALTTALGGGGSTSGPAPSGNVTATGENTEHIIYAIYFRTSEYNTFADKIDAIAAITNGLKKNLGAIEGFGEFEKEGNEKYDPLISFSTDLNNPWMNTEVEAYFNRLDSVLYGLDFDYLREGIRSSATEINGNATGYTVREEDYEAGTLNMPQNQNIAFELRERLSEISLLMKIQAWNHTTLDIEALTMQCDNLTNGSSGGNPPGIIETFECREFDRLMDILYTIIPPLRNGTYKSTAEYRLPGLDIPTTFKQMTFVK